MLLDIWQLNKQTTFTISSHAGSATRKAYREAWLCSSGIDQRIQRHLESGNPIYAEVVGYMYCTKAEFYHEINFLQFSKRKFSVACVGLISVMTGSWNVTAKTAYLLCTINTSLLGDVQFSLLLNHPAQHSLVCEYLTHLYILFRVMCWENKCATEIILVKVTTTFCSAVPAYTTLAHVYNGWVTMCKYPCSETSMHSTTNSISVSSFTDESPATQIVIEKG